MEVEFDTTPMMRSARRVYGKATKSKPTGNGVPKLLKLRRVSPSEVHKSTKLFSDKTSKAEVTTSMLKGLHLVYGMTTNTETTGHNVPKYINILPKLSDHIPSKVDESTKVSDGEESADTPMRRHVRHMAYIITNENQKNTEPWTADSTTVDEPLFYVNNITTAGDPGDPLLLEPKEEPEDENTTPTAEQTIDTEIKTEDNQDEQTTDTDKHKTKDIEEKHTKDTDKQKNINIGKQHTTDIDKQNTIDLEEYITDNEETKTINMEDSDKEKTQKTNRKTYKIVKLPPHLLKSVKTRTVSSDRLMKYLKAPTTKNDIWINRVLNSGAPITKNDISINRVLNTGAPMTKNNTSINRVLSSGAPITKNDISINRVLNTGPPMTKNDTSINRVLSSGAPITKNDISVNRVLNTGAPMTKNDTSINRVLSSGAPITKNDISINRVLNTGAPITKNDTSINRVLNSGAPITKNDISVNRVLNSGAPITKNDISINRVLNTGAPITKNDTSINRVLNNDLPPASLVTDFESYRQPGINKIFQSVKTYSKHSSECAHSSQNNPTLQQDDDFDNVDTPYLDEATGQFKDPPDKVTAVLSPRVKPPKPTFKTKKNTVKRTSLLQKIEDNTLKNLAAEDLFREFKKLQSKVRYYRQRDLLQRERKVKTGKEIKMETHYEKLTEHMNPIAKKIFWSQISLSNPGKTIHSHRFSPEEKVLAVAIRKLSPPCYRILEKIFILPNDVTIKRMNKMMVDRAKAAIANQAAKQEADGIQAENKETHNIDGMQEDGVQMQDPNETMTATSNVLDVLPQSMQNTPLKLVLDAIFRPRTRSVKTKDPSKPKPAHKRNQKKMDETAQAVAFINGNSEFQPSEEPIQTAVTRVNEPGVVTLKANSYRPRQNRKVRILSNEPFNRTCPIDSSPKSEFAQELQDSRVYSTSDVNHAGVTFGSVKESPIINHSYQRHIHIVHAEPKESTTIVHSTSINPRKRKILYKAVPRENQPKILGDGSSINPIDTNISFDETTENQSTTFLHSSSMNPRKRKILYKAVPRENQPKILVDGSSINPIDTNISFDETTENQSTTFLHSSSVNTRKIQKSSNTVPKESQPTMLVDGSSNKARVVKITHLVSRDKHGAKIVRSPAINSNISDPPPKEIQTIPNNCVTTEPDICNNTDESPLTVAPNTNEYELVDEYGNYLNEVAYSIEIPVHTSYPSMPQL